MEYLWTKDIEPPSFQALAGDASTDVLIIGGGIAGILCALRLQQAGVDYMLVEGKRIGGGITKGTTAVLSAQHDTLYQDMIKSIGTENSRLYLEANVDAVQQFRSLAGNVPCDFEERPSIMYSLYDRALMEDEARAVQSLGFAAEFTESLPLPLPVAGAVRYPDMAQLHPLKLAYGAAQGLCIYENTFVQRLQGTTAITEKGRISAKRVIVATHFPFVNRHGLYFAKQYQQRSYVIALQGALQLDCTAVDAAQGGVYLRNYKGLLLVGGGDERTGSNGKGFDVPREFARKHFPNAREKYAWANQDCVTLDGVPYIGKYSSGFHNVYVATGFGLWGMTTAMVAARLLTDMVLGQDNKFAPAFATNRSMLTRQLLANMGTTLVDLATPTTKRCSHLGCALKWNPAEHSWDCPCHGSRFDEHGRLIDNPAMRDSRVE